MFYREQSGKGPNYKYKLKNIKNKMALKSYQQGSPTFDLNPISEASLKPDIK